MNRRDFVAGAALAGASSAFASGIPNGILSASPDFTPPPNGRNSQAPSDADELSRKALIVDGLDVSALNETYLHMLERGGVSCWHKSVDGLEGFAALYRFLDSHSEVVAALSIKDIREAKRLGRIAIVAGWQSAEGLGDAQNSAIGGPPHTVLRAYYQLGLRICGIAYNVTNIFGGGCLEPRVGLTRAGARLVEEIHQLKIVLDVGGHTGEQTSLDAIAASSGRPVICSHSNVAAITDNPRCVSDRLIEAIAKTGGVVGVSAVNDFMIRSRKDASSPRSPRVTVEAFLDQLDYIRKLVGVDHVGIGPDFVEGRQIPYGAVNRAIITPEMISDGEWSYAKGFENISELPNVTAGLLRRDWPTGDIVKVLGKNWLRVYELVWGA
jgi:membrane dipeptidase